MKHISNALVVCLECSNVISVSYNCHPMVTCQMLIEMLQPLQLALGQIIELQQYLVEQIFGNIFVSGNHFNARGSRYRPQTAKFTHVMKRIELESLAIILKDH